MTTVLDGPEALRGTVGTDLGTSNWVTVGPAEVELFLDVAPDPAAPLGTIPPMLVLALTNLFLPEIVDVRGFSAGVNYGTGAVRFGPPMPSGNRLRAHAHVLEVEDVRGGLQATIRFTVEVEGVDQPACVVNSLSRYLF